MKKFLRILKWAGIVLLVIIAGIFISGFILYNKKYDAPYPGIQASKDSAVIARGKHLVYTTAHCAECHFKPGDSLKIMNGEEAELAGGSFPFEFPGGVFYSKNISSDKETGIGNLTDGEIARALRYGVKHDGSALIPAMEFQNLTDDDLTAIISYLRTLPPIHLKVPDNDFNLFGKAIIAFFIRPQAPAVAPPKSIPYDTTAAFGGYIVNSVSGCRSCHTERNPNTGEYIGQDLAGGPWGPVPGNPTKLLVAPNLTPDASGILHDWNFEVFSNRFSKGNLIPGSVMPWGQFKHLDSTELKAIWKYLHSIPAVHRENGASIQDIK